MRYYKVSTTEKQVKMFAEKYNKEYQKMLNAEVQGNEPMRQHYKRVVDTMKMSLSLLGVHIDGVNRPTEEEKDLGFSILKLWRHE